MDYFTYLWGIPWGEKTQSSDHLWSDHFRDPGHSSKRGTWNPKQPFINGCFNWMIPNLYIGNGCFTKHPFLNGCLGFQVVENHPLVNCTSTSTNLRRTFDRQKVFSTEIAYPNKVAKCCACHEKCKDRITTYCTSYVKFEREFPGDFLIFSVFFTRWCRIHPSGALVQVDQLWWTFAQWISQKAKFLIKQKTQRHVKFQ